MNARHAADSDAVRFRCQRTCVLRDSFVYPFRLPDCFEQQKKYTDRRFNMAIAFDETQKIFKLDTDHTTYMIGLTDDGYAGHLYYGARLHASCGRQALRLRTIPVPAELPREKNGFMNAFCFEYPTGGLGDSRESCLDVEDENGCSACELVYDSFEIVPGKPALPGLPASFGDPEDVTTLKIYLKDHVLNLTVCLIYSAFEKEDVITRSAVITCGAGRKIRLRRVLSACLDMENRDLSMVTLAGAWARERHIQTNRITYGRQNIASVSGVSGHQESPFLAVVTPGTDQNFIAQAELSQFDTVRVTMGIHPWQFCWELSDGASFTAPEVVMTYSGAGLGTMTRSLHDFYRGHLIRSPYLHHDRPVLLNSWEGTYFDFDRDRLLAMARQAKACGIEMFVLDDGWFGHRNDDSTSLGDWYVNEKKLPGGLVSLSDAVHGMGLKFGLWIEPEMISPDSDLFRKHPDYAIQIPGREPGRARNQLVLDITRKEVRDAVCRMLKKNLEGVKIDYIKWDMNRYLSDIGSTLCNNGRQGEIFHRYVLGLYEMQARLLEDFPGLLLENCASGGGRFDPGMLYFSPQIWTSDDTDAIERLRIQEGTEMCYPLSCMGAHVSKCPNDQVGRQTPLETRANVAFAGTFGYELDLKKHLTEEERALIPQQIARYHAFHHIVEDGDYYRLVSWDDSHPLDAWMCVTKDRTEALLTVVQVLGRPNEKGRCLRLDGLDPTARYRVEHVSGVRLNKVKDEKAYAQTDDEAATAQSPDTEGLYYGDELMQVGLFVPEMQDFQSDLMHLVRV